VSYANIEYSDTDANVTVATRSSNQLTIVTTEDAVNLLTAGGVVAIAINGERLTALGTTFTVDYDSNVTFSLINSIDTANTTIVVEDDLFMQDGFWDYYPFDAELEDPIQRKFDADITEVINGNVTVTLEVPNIVYDSNTAISLTDRANANYASVGSLMKFIHNSSIISNN
jgi:hypothetical protein